MIKTTTFLASLCACCCLARPAMAWDAEGHMVVAQIAYNHLDADVKAKCDALIAAPVFHSTTINSNFVTAAVWADDIKSFTSAFSDSHYIDIPISLDGTPTNGVANDPSNVVMAIRQCITTLQDPTQTLSN
jgi:S1/P1 Nuclease